MESGFLLDVVVGKGAAIFELLASEDETLLIRRNAFLVLDLGLDVVDGIAGLDLKSDGLPSEGLDDCGKISEQFFLSIHLISKHTDLHASAQAENKMKS